MKIEDVKIGMHLRDPKGNVWKVVDTPNLTGIPTFYARCIKFQHPVGVMPSYTIDTEEKARVGRHLWCNKKHLIVVPDSVLKQFKDYLSSADTIKVVTGLNKTADLHFVTQEQYDNVEVTLEALVPIPEAVCYTVADLSIGMVFEDANGNRYSVSGWMQDKVLLHTVLYPNGVSGEVLKLHASFWVDLEASQDTVSLQDFRKVEN